MKDASDAARSFWTVTPHRFHLVVFALLIVSIVGSARAASTGSVSGVVRDSSGVPQIGAEVQLLRPNLSVIASVYTDAAGSYSFSSVEPGRYALKATGAWFLPALREDLRIRSKTIVNLTLNSLYEAMQWLPAEPGTGKTQAEDWAWTLRSAANRPLLRWLEDGPLVVVEGNTDARPKLKARLEASGQENVFAQSSERLSAAIDSRPNQRRELMASVAVDSGADASVESMAGVRQQLGFAGSLQSVAAVAFHPEIESTGPEPLNGLVELLVNASETIHLGDAVQVEAGSSGVVARLSGDAPDTVSKLLPFASVNWRSGNSGIRYRVRTQLPGAADQDDSEASSWLPALSARNGALAIEDGLHQEIGWERQTDRSEITILVLDDSVDNPAVEAMSHLAAGKAADSAALLDPESGLLRAAGPHLSSLGAEASLEHQLPEGLRARIEYANSDALVFTAASGASPASLLELLDGLHPRRTQAFSLSLSGTLDGAGTRWRASYRCQPENSVTPVDPYEEGAVEPYINLHLGQTVHLRRIRCGSFEALLDLRNLLAQGYRPYLLSDGSLLIFAQQQRSVRAGLAFNF